MQITITIPRTGLLYRLVVIALGCAILGAFLLAAAKHHAAAPLRVYPVNATIPA